jgi:hypothetical protein
MPNHVHLLLECSGFPLSKFMQGLQPRYRRAGRAPIRSLHRRIVRSGGLAEAMWDPGSGDGIHRCTHMGSGLDILL